MNKLLSILFVFSIVFVAGCIGQTAEQKAPPGPQPPSLEVISALSTVNAGEAFTISWSVSSPERKSIGHTAIHYGTASVPGTLSTEISPPMSGYPSLSQIQAGDIPGTYSTQLTISELGTYYYRAHAIVDGKHYWSSEKTVVVAGVLGEAGKGTAIFTIADKAVNLSDVSKIDITINLVQIHSAAAGNDSWMSLSSQEQTYDLLELRSSGFEKLLGQIQLDAGLYNQVRLNISRVLVTWKTSMQQEAKLPSNMLRIVGNLVVEANKTLVAKFDFLADESLHQTSDNKLILAPVVKFEVTKGTEANVMQDKRVTKSGGEAVISSKVGMDQNGEVGEGKRIDSAADVSIDASGKVTVVTGQPSTTPAAAKSKEFTIEADDVGYYVNGSSISSITVTKGDKVMITFKVKTTNVYAAGLDFRGSSYFTMGKVSPGTQNTVEFTAGNTFTVTSYWPNSGTRKADLQVVVA